MYMPTSEDQSPCQDHALVIMCLSTVHGYRDPGGTDIQFDLITSQVDLHRENPQTTGCNNTITPLHAIHCRVGDQERSCRRVAKSELRNTGNWSIIRSELARRVGSSHHPAIIHWEIPEKSPARLEIEHYRGQ